MISWINFSHWLFNILKNLPPTLVDCILLFSHSYFRLVIFVCLSCFLPSVLVLISKVNVCVFISPHCFYALLTYRRHLCWLSIVEKWMNAFIRLSIKIICIFLELHSFIGHLIFKKGLWANEWKKNTLICIWCKNYDVIVGTYAFFNKLPWRISIGSSEN